MMHSLPSLPSLVPFSHSLTVNVQVEDPHIRSAELKLFWANQGGSIGSYGFHGEAVFSFVNELLNEEKCTFGGSLTTRRPRNIYTGMVTYYNGPYSEGLTCYFGGEIGIGGTERVFFPDTQLVQVMYPTVLKNPTVQQKENQDLLANKAKFLIQKVMVRLLGAICSMSVITRGECDFSLQMDNLIFK